MAIDQDIAQRVDAYRGNPQALQQRYANNKELLDLLALQRLKSEKDDAMRKIQLEMQQDPQTIKQQKERQLLEMTKQDLTKQTAGIMQNAQNRQQKNMQNVAKKGAPSPQQMQQVQSGLGALAQRQQGQAPMRMAEGGIVAFAAGGPITQADIDKYRSTGGQGNISPSNRMKMTDEEIRTILERTAATEGSRVGMSKVRDQAKALNPNTSLGTVKNSGKDGSSVPITTAVLQEKDAEVTADPLKPKTVVAPAVAKKEVVAPAVAKKEATEGGLGSIDTLTNVPIDMTGINANQTGQNILTQAGLGPQDPDAAMIKKRDEASSFLGRGKKADTMNNYLEQLKAMDVSQQDPDKLRDQEISAFLRGTAGGGSFGQTMAGGSQGMADERSAQEKSSRDRLLSRLGIEQSAMDMDLKIAGSALESGKGAYDQAMANQRSIGSILASTSGDQVQLALQAAKNELDTNQNNIGNKLKQFEIQMTNALRMDMAASEKRQHAGQELQKLAQFTTELYQSELAENPALIAAKNLAASDKPPSNIADIVEQAYNLSLVQTTELLEKGGILATQSQFMKIFDGGSGKMPTSPTSSDFKVSPQLQTILDRYK